MWPAAFFLLLQAAADPIAGPIDEGRKALDANQFDRAAELFTQATRKYPADYAAHFHLGLAYSLKNDDARAIPEYARTLELKPGLYQAQLNLGISLLRAGRAAEAIKPLEAAAAQKPRELQPRIKLASAYLASQRYSEAQQAYSAAAESDPKSADAELGLAKSIAAQDHLDAAAPHFRRAAELDPKFRDALLELAGLTKKQSSPPKRLPFTNSSLVTRRRRNGLVNCCWNRSGLRMPSRAWNRRSRNRLLPRIGWRSRPPIE